MLGAHLGHNAFPCTFNTNICARYPCLKLEVPVCLEAVRVVLFKVQAGRARKALPVVDCAQASAAEKTEYSGMLSEVVRKRNAEVGASVKARATQARAVTRKPRLATCCCSAGLEDVSGWQGQGRWPK